MKKFLLLALSQLFALCVFADGVPRYYELVTSADQLESGKYYVIVAIPEAESLTYRMAYNGINIENHTGEAGNVIPNHLWAQLGITESQFSGIIDIGKTGNSAKPLKMVKNGPAWNFIDESVAEKSRLVGVNAETSAESDKHYLIANDETQSTNLNSNLNLWNIVYMKEDIVKGRVYISNAGKTCYLKYDANNYGEAASFFRVYAQNEKQNLMLYKEMETITATTSFTGHGTLYYSDKVLMVPEEVTAKTYTFNSSDKRVYSNTEYPTEYLIPANSAVIFRGEKSTTYTFPVINHYTPTRDDANILRGFDEDGTTTSGTENDQNYYFYKLTTQNHVESSVGFYWGAADGAPFTSAAHKAYLAIEKNVAANIRSFLLDFSETTSISNVSLPTPEETKWVYDLSGRRFSTSQSLPKGIYISNGKKFVVK